jgi:hypothetical protein
MGRLDIFKRDGTNPYFLVTVIGVVLVIIALIYAMTALPFKQKSAEATPAGSGANLPAGSAEVALEGNAAPSNHAGEVELEEVFEVETGQDVSRSAGAGDSEASQTEPRDALSGDLPSDSFSGGAPGAGAAQDESLEEMKTRIEKEWEQLLETFESEGISVDLENKRVMVKGAIIRDKESPRYPIEYVVVSEGGNTHEALVLIKAVPSSLNAALLSLGLEPGKSVIYRKKDPPPPPEDVESGRVSAYEVIPPSGTVMKIGVMCEEWGEGEIRPLEDLILDLRTRRSLERVGWVYVGSRFASVLLGKERVQRYMADMERNVVALYLTGYGNAVFDVNTIDGVDDSLFDVNPEKAPSLGAKVTLVFSI